MQRYFSDQKNNDEFILNSDDSFHIKKVMRMNIHDKIEIIYQKQVYICEIVNLDNLVKVRLLKIDNENHELKKKVIICQSLVNEQKMDLILQKGTELGAYAFYPYKSLNSVVKENDKSSKKIIRWQRIVKEASEQSKRNVIPKVYDFIDINDLKKFKNALKIICTVNETTKSLKTVLQSNLTYDTIIIVIGPEGGFSINEEKILIDNGFIAVSLGSRVLRTETASLVVLSMLNYEWMVSDAFI